MNEKEMKKLEVAWKVLNESLNTVPLQSVSEGEPNVGQVPDDSFRGMINPETVEVVQVKDGKSVVDSEREEAPSGPSYSSGGEPGSPGYWVETKTMEAVLVVDIIDAYGSGEPIEINDSNLGMVHKLITPHGADDDLEYSIFPALREDPKSESAWSGFEFDDDSGLLKWSVKALGGNKVQIVMSIPLKNETPPEADGGDDWGYDRFEESINESLELLKRLKK